MYSYVAIIQNKPSPSSAFADCLHEALQRLHPDWVLSSINSAFSVFHKKPSSRAISALRFGIKHGLLLGALFPSRPRRFGGDIGSGLDATEGDSIVLSRGRYLVDNFWGAYIAFFAVADGSECFVLRDPSASIPCFRLVCGDTTIVFSNLSDLAGLPLPPMTVNTAYLVAFLYEPELAHRESAVREINEVLAGECLEIVRGQVRHVALWDPRAICRGDVIEDFEDASRLVREITQSCIDRWASKYDRIVHMLSGGLDSSIVLGCLRHSPMCPQITCLHYETDGPDGREVEYAKLAASLADFTLIIEPAYSNESRYDERIFRLPKTAKPSISNLAITMESGLRNHVPAQVGAQSVWDGQGGDHLFFEARTAFGAIDYAFSRGLTGNFLRHALSGSIQSRSSFWAIIAKSFRLGTLRRPWRPEHEYKRTSMFVNSACVADNLIDYVWQPWVDAAYDVPPGKRWQICMLACLLHRHRPVPELQYASELHPFFSQPLMELCLRIPIYTLVQGRVSRALERHAFENYVPKRIRWRENKGSIATTLMSKIRQSMPFLRDLILDGYLVSEKIVERDALEPYFKDNRPLNFAVFWPFLSCIAAEVWARNWTTDSWHV